MLVSRLLRGSEVTVSSRLLEREWAASSAVRYGARRLEKGCLQEINLTCARHQRQ